MKIVYLAAGAANMLCGSCLHDNTLAAALLEAGHDTLLVPTYTPIRTDEDDVSLQRVFFGGINVYLQQKLPPFRHTPWVFDALLDQPDLIRFATRIGPAVDAEKLGDLAVSMLEGEHGHQRKELDKLVTWLRNEARPEIVHLSNAMLMGMAREIRGLGVPVVATLSGEDIFLEKLQEPFYSQARQLLRARAAELDAFVALNRYYADFMAEYLAVPRDRIHVIPHGLKLAGHGTRPERQLTGSSQSAISIGYLARICHDKGLHLLVAACEILAADPSLPPINLRVAGYFGAGDRKYFEALRQQAAGWPSPERFEYLGELTRDQKIAFLQSVDIFSVPTVYRESKGLPALEAWANAVPVVLPAHGTFPELIEDTGGGLLFTPDDPAALAAALKQLIQDPALATAMGLRGQAAVRDRYHAAAMGHKTIALYESLLTTARNGQAGTDAGPASGT